MWTLLFALSVLPRQRYISLSKAKTLLKANMSQWTDISMNSYIIKKGTDVMASQYVSYSLQSTKDGQVHAVERRFSEFVLLQKELAKEFPAAIIAPLPKDQVFGRFKPSFIESRMRGLEDFLKKAYSDVEMSKSCLWNPFFSVMTFNDLAVNEAKSLSGSGVSQRRSSWIDTVKNMAAVQMAKPVSALFILCSTSYLLIYI